MTSRPAGRGVLLAAVFATALAGSSCVSIGDPAAWADGEVRELDSGRPIQGALVFIEYPAERLDSTGTDRTNEAGHFAVFQAVERGQRTILLVVVADGFKRAELPLPVLRSNPLIARLATAGSSKASRIEQMPESEGDGDGTDGSCGSQ